MKKLFFVPFFILLFLSLIIPISTKAVEEAQAEEFNVNAQVLSPVSADNSYTQVNAQETLADPVNHPILLMVTLFDKNGVALPEREVTLTSDRGNVDIIEATSKISEYQVHAAEISSFQKDKTDDNGMVSFRVTSFIPGRAILSVKADSVELKSQTVKFTSLPFPLDLTITVDLLWTQKGWTIFSPHLQEENLSPLQKEAKIIANPGAKIKINFWIFALFLLIVIGMPIFIILNFINLRKMRWMEKEQTLLLKKMFPPDYNRQGKQLK